MLVKNNHLSGKIIVLPGKIEGISLPEAVDVIISEPTGYMLFNERMLESYLHSKKWLKSNGMMLPTFSDIHLAPFSDEQLYVEHFSRANFWVTVWLSTAPTEPLTHWYQVWEQEEAGGPLRLQHVQTDSKLSRGLPEQCVW
ncbi:histone-arginine methyltransferase CARM1-like [Papio anubis]|uniref:histone-arginine methyltransferase CARM1-like n=1 Tax=Papio anubis TaxID=9555 RepID=UPI000B7B6920|nr:histone-arginine methyltransferase CARM1-like [Papio anubis]